MLMTTLFYLYGDIFISFRRYRRHIVSTIQLYGKGDIEIKDDTRLNQEEKMGTQLTDTRREKEIIDCISKNLKQAMDEKGLNPSQIMKITGLSQAAAYSVFKKGKKTIPTIMTLDRIGEVLNLSLSEILRDCHHMDITLRDRKLGEINMLLEQSSDEVLDRELAYLKQMRAINKAMKSENGDTDNP